MCIRDSLQIAIGRKGIVAHKGELGALDIVARNRSRTSGRALVSATASATARRNHCSTGDQTQEITTRNSASHTKAFQSTFKAASIVDTPPFNAQPSCGKTTTKGTGTFVVVRVSDNKLRRNVSICNIWDAERGFAVTDRDFPPGPGDLSQSVTGRSCFVVQMLQIETIEGPGNATTAKEAARCATLAVVWSGLRCLPR